MPTDEQHAAFNAANNPTVGIDFDGTMVTHEYPDIGVEIGAFEWIRRVRAMGVNVILWTMRSGPELDAAVDHVRANGVELFGINTNPTQSAWTSSPKAYCQLYVDDAALAVPLTNTLPDGSEFRGRSFVDWSVVGPLLVAWANTAPRVR